MATCNQIHHAATHKFERWLSKTKWPLVCRLCLKEAHFHALIKTECRLCPNYRKDITEVLKNSRKPITSIDALSVNSFSSWLHSTPSKRKSNAVSMAVFLIPLLFGWCLTFYICRAGTRAIGNGLEMPLLSPSQQTQETRFSHSVTTSAPKSLRVLISRK